MGWGRLSKISTRKKRGRFRYLVSLGKHSTTVYADSADQAWDKAIAWARRYKLNMQEMSMIPSGKR